jgi:sec-independent protein translocase protein TatB
MFDIGFWELALIGVVALLVVGPDRLPGLARTIGLWVGRIRRYVSTVRDDIEREIQADELRKMLDKPDELNPLKDIIDETTGSIADAKKELADVEKNAEDMMSEDAEVETTDSSASSSGASETIDDDETGADAITPHAAATTLGEAVTGGDDEAVPEGSAAGDEETESHERRSG